MHTGNESSLLAIVLPPMAAAAAVLWGVYNIGQLTNGKQKAVNAADAAALAGATVEARTLNLMAYNNRSIIANEVFMIQTTALQGYMQYLSHTADNIEDYAKWIPYVGEVLSAILTTVEKITAAIEKAMEINDVPVVVDFRVHRDAMVWPMVAAGMSNDEIQFARDLAPKWEREEA